MYFKVELILKLEITFLHLEFGISIEPWIMKIIMKLLLMWEYNWFWDEIAINMIG